MRVLSAPSLPLDYASECDRLRCYLAHALTLERDHRVTRRGKSVKLVPALALTLAVRLTATMGA